MSKPRASTRNSGGAFSQAETFGFILGEWMPCRSSNVRAAQWDPSRDVLTLEFKDGSFYEYAPVNRDLARDFAHAPSKGHWRHVNFPKDGPGYLRVYG